MQQEEAAHHADKAKGQDGESAGDAASSKDPTFVTALARGQFLRDGANDGVGRAAGRPWIDDRDRTTGIVIRGQGRACGEQQARRGPCLQQAASRVQQ